MSLFDRPKSISDENWAKVRAINKIHEMDHVLFFVTFIGAGAVAVLFFHGTNIQIFSCASIMLAFFLPRMYRSDSKRRKLLQELEKTLPPGHYLISIDVKIQQIGVLVEGDKQLEVARENTRLNKGSFKVLSQVLP